MDQRSDERETQSRFDLQEVQDRTSQLIDVASRSNYPTLIEAPPASGKTTSAIRLAETSDTPITYLASRLDLYDQAGKICDNIGGVDWSIVPSPHRQCPTFRGEYEGLDRQVKRLYAQGMSGFRIHTSDTVRTPCGSDCPYTSEVKRLTDDIDSIDVLIGHHSHVLREAYIKNRIVILDEFNVQPFLKSFPDETSSITDDPGLLIRTFLQDVHKNESSFPEELQDPTDLIEKRHDAEVVHQALDWFREYGASRGAAQENYDFFSPSGQRYDSVNYWAPLLTMSILCMGRLGPGLELAPHPNGVYDDDWTKADLGLATGCLRNRDSGEMHVLTPPDLSSASQVIGLDGLPTVELWDRLFAPENGFEHEQVIPRTEYTGYLQQCLNMDLVQLGSGMYHYAGGQISPMDETRFEYIRIRENGDRFPLISTRKALLKYDGKGIIETFVKPIDDRDNIPDSETLVNADYLALHYSLVRSSNIFEQETLGVVFGSPLPSDEQVVILAGLCGHHSVAEGEGDEKSFGEFGDKIFSHESHHQVVQATLRFGREKSVASGEGSTVYLSTLAVPDWFEPHEEQEVKNDRTRNAVIEQLIESSRNADRPPSGWERVGTLVKAMNAASVSDRDTTSESEEEFKRSTIQYHLDELAEEGLVEVREKSGSYGANLYRWIGDDYITDSFDGIYVLQHNEEICLLQLSDD